MKDVDGTVTDCAQAGMAMPAVQAHAASRKMELSYSSDGVRWFFGDVDDVLLFQGLICLPGDCWLSA